MDNLQSSDLIKNIHDNDIPENVKLTETYLRSRYGYTLRISMILQVIKDFLGKTEFDTIDERFCNNALVDSTSMDYLIGWSEGKDTNFSELYRILEKEYNFSMSEKLYLDELKIEEKLWGFFRSLSNY